MDARLGDTSAPKNFPCVKNSFWRIFGTQRNLKACSSESIYKENISNIWYIGKQLCWRTIRTTKKSSRRTRALKLLTMSCHIKVRQSFLVNRNRIWTSVQVVNGRLTFIFLQIFLSFCYVVVVCFSKWSLLFAELSNLHWTQLFNDILFACACTVSCRFSTIPMR